MNTLFSPHRSLYVVLHSDLLPALLIPHYPKRFRKRTLEHIIYLIKSSKLEVPNASIIYIKNSLSSQENEGLNGN